MFTSESVDTQKENLLLLRFDQVTEICFTKTNGWHLKGSNMVYQKACFITVFIMK